MKNDNMITSFCGQKHRVSDGKPVAHVCQIVPTKMLIAEKKGDKVSMQAELSQWKNRRSHNGLKG